MDRVHGRDLDGHKPPKPRLQPALDPIRVGLGETGTRHHAERRLAGYFLYELKLPYTGERIVVHVDSRPGNPRAVVRHQALLRAVTENLRQDRMLAAAGGASIADIRREISGPISNERDDFVDEGGPDDLASLSGRGDRKAFVVDQLEQPVGRPDVIESRAFTSRRRDDFLGLTVA